MSTLLVILLAVALLAVVARLAVLRWEWRGLAEAIRQKRPYLPDRPSLLNRWLGFEQTAMAVNDLLNATARAREAEESYLRQIEATLGNIQEGVLIVNGANEVVLVNDGLKHLLGRVSVGQRVDAILPNATFLEYLRVLKRGQNPPRQLIEFTRGKEVLYFEASGALIAPIDGGDQPYALFVLHDISRQKHLERLRTDFVANVSHELRTPITIIKGYTDTLVEDHWTLPEEERERFLQKIQKNVIRLHRLLEDLLTLTRLEHGTERIEKQTLALGRLAAEVAENFRARRDLEIIPIRLALPSAAVDWVNADPIRLQQVLENLLDNATRHAKGATWLQIRIEAVGAQVVCSVEDNGCGIPASDLPHLFERFFRVDKGRARDRGGTGLGLSIVKHIVQQHGGTVGVESQSGAGTRIFFSVPAAVPPPGAQVLREPARSPDAPVASPS